MNYLKIRTVIIALFLAATMLVVSAEGRSLNETDSQLPRLLFNDSQEKVTIQNGFGFTHEDGVYLIPEGSITYYSSDGIVRVFDSTGKQLLITNATDSQKISTPVGYFSATKIYRVPSGALINTKGINTLVTLNEKPIVTIIFENSTLTTNEKRTNSNILTLQDGVFNGYIEDAQYSGVNNLGSFITDWIIPSPAPNPSSYTVQYSIWNGIQPGMPDPGGKLSIVQPVIEWNFTHWTGSAVYKDSYHDFFYYAPMGSVNVGDTIEGQLIWDRNNNWWYIRIWDLTNGYSNSNVSVLAPEIGTTNLFVMTALEGYSIKGNSDLPGTTTFSNIQFKDVNGNPITINLNPWMSPEAQTLLTGLNVTSPSSSTAILYTDKNYTITPVAGAGGAIYPPNIQYVRSGANSPTFTITASQGYLIDTVYINDIPSGELHTYIFQNVQSNSTIRATFRPVPTYTITPSASPGGSISPSTPQTVPSGNNMTFSIAPNSGYVIQNVTVDGSKIGPVTNYTFYNVTAPHSITANFTPPPIASFTATPRTGTIPLTVTFTDTSTGSPNIWSWDFGDGNLTNATVKNPVHTYTGRGSFSVNLTVTNTSSGSNMTTQKDLIRVGNLSGSIGVFRGGLGWYLDSNRNGGWDDFVNDTSYTFGQPGDIPVTGDWNGDNKTDVGVFRNGTWSLDMNNNGTWDGTPTDTTFYWGLQPGDIPITGDWNGNGITETGIFRNGGYWYLDMNNNGTWDGTPTDTTFYWGKVPGDIPITGDWNGNGITKTGIFRPGTGFYLDMNNNGQWDSGDRMLAWGLLLPNDTPVTGDWNGNGITEAGIFRNNHDWYLDYNGNGTWDDFVTDVHGAIGQPNDTPVTGKWR